MNVGAAEIDLTPDFEVELSGFAARIQPSTGVLEPIFARAIFIDDGDEKLLWITCDLIALKRDFVESFRGWAQRELNLPPHQVLICCTHTHNGPATVHLNAAGRYCARFVDLLQDQLQQLARRAMSVTSPCTIVSGRVTVALAVDRRGKPSAHTDPKLSLLLFRTHSRAVAAVVNYAMHPVALGHVERRISPDWCGAAAHFVSRALDAVTMVTNGAAGNLNPPAEGISPERVRALGFEIGSIALGIIARAARFAGSLRVRSIHVPIALDVLDERGIDDDADAFAASIPAGHAWEHAVHSAISAWRSTMKQTIAAGGGREVEIEIQAIRIGEVKIVAINGELFSRFTTMLRERVGDNLFVVGYANAAFGYIPTREAYAEGGYEVEQAHFFYNSFRPVPGTLEMLVDRAAELVKSL
jgi:hypothetical protein